MTTPSQNAIDMKIAEIRNSYNELAEKIQTEVANYNRTSFKSFDLSAGKSCTD